MSHRSRFVLLFLPLVLLLWAPTAPAGEAAGPEEALIKAKAPAIVALKYVLQITSENSGQVRERPGSAFGVVVDGSGLIMVPASRFEVRMIPRGGRRGRRAGGRPPPNVTTTPTNIRVTVPGQEKEWTGILAAKDSKSGLAFILVSDLPATKKLAAVDFTKPATVKIGQDLYGVARLSQGFDHAPYCDRVRVLGKVTKPKTMWYVQNKVGFVGMPLYDAAGGIAGVYTVQSGVGEGGGSRLFLLPLTSLKRTVASAVKEAQRLREELEEAADEAKEEAEEKKKADDKKKADAPKKEDG